MLGLKFTMEARHGGTVLVDMTALDPRPLAIAFAGALRRSAALGGPIGAASVIKQYVQVYRHFFVWLADEGLTVVGVSDLRAVPIDGFASRSEEHTSELQSLMRITNAVFCLKKQEKNK